MYFMWTDKAVYTSGLRGTISAAHTLATRFDENNCHAECRHCNRFKADPFEGYRVNLITKIGQQKFDLLKVKVASTSKMTDFEYEQLIQVLQGP